MRTGIAFIDNINDKVKHFIVGMVIQFITMFFLVGSLWLLAPVTIIAVGKEVYDRRYGKTGFDFFDILATLAGGFVGAVLYYIVAAVLQ